LLSAQRFLMNLWHASDKDTLISMSRPLSYADRVRIRQPGDAGFALGPHIDGGSVERWEPEGYGLGNVYDKIFQGSWEDYDPWNASSRVPVVSDLYNGAGACSMFRMFQGWLSMSHTSPFEGTLKVNPLLQLSTAYVLLRPFFAPINQTRPFTDSKTNNFLRADNWRLKSGDEMTSELHGANPGTGQELSEMLHPHLDLERTMVHMPKVKPGDYVVWHCDSKSFPILYFSPLTDFLPLAIHAVDKTHTGKSDSSVLYIPVCPTTETNAEYLAMQRDAFLSGFPGPDFPGGKGESEHIGRPTVDYLMANAGSEGIQAMGLDRLGAVDGEDTRGAKKVIESANTILGFK
jgi:hypothetical protein